jgi:hypothetical protein
MKNETAEELIKGIGIDLDDSLFEDKENKKEETTEEKKELNEEKTETKEMLDVNPITLEERLEKEGVTKNDLIEYVIQIADDGYLKETGSIFNNKIEFEFRTSLLSSSRDYLNFFEKNKIETQSLVEYYINLYSLASILYMYRGEILPASIEDRTKWIENTLIGPVYAAMVARSNKFHARLDLVVSAEAESFF